MSKPRAKRTPPKRKSQKPRSNFFLPPSPKPEQPLLSLGYITQPHGLHGEFRVHLHNAKSEALYDNETFYLQLPEEKTLRQFEVRSVHKHSKGYLVKIKDCRYRDQAESLKRAEIFVLEEELPALEEDEYYFFELEGLPVFSPEGDALGHVDHVLPNPGNPLMVVAYQERQVMIPIVEALVPEIDLEEGKIIVRPIPGLFDDESS